MLVLLLLLISVAVALVLASAAASVAAASVAVAFLRKKGHSQDLHPGLATAVQLLRKGMNCVQCMKGLVMQEVLINLFPQVH